MALTLALTPGFVTVWNISQEERDFEFQGMGILVYVFSSSLSTAHSEAVKAVLFSPGELSSYTTTPCEVSIVLLLDGSQVCSCGADKIVRLLDLPSKSEIVSKPSPDVFT